MSTHPAINTWASLPPESQPLCLSHLSRKMLIAFRFQLLKNDDDDDRLFLFFCFMSLLLEHLWESDCFIGQKHHLMTYPWFLVKGNFCYSQTFYRVMQQLRHTGWMTEMFMTCKLLFLLKRDKSDTSLIWHECEINDSWIDKKTKEKINISCSLVMRLKIFSNCM